MRPAGNGRKKGKSRSHSKTREGEGSASGGTTNRESAARLRSTSLVCVGRSPCVPEMSQQLALVFRLPAFGLGTERLRDLCTSNFTAWLVASLSSTHQSFRQPCSTGDVIVVAFP